MKHKANTYSLIYAVFHFFLSAAALWPHRLSANCGCSVDGQVSDSAKGQIDDVNSSTAATSSLAAWKERVQLNPIMPSKTNVKPHRSSVPRKSKKRTPA